MIKTGAHRRLAHAAIGIAAAVLGGLVSAPVVGQETATVITPLKTQPDVNNVNIATGLIRVDVPSLSVPAAPRLRFENLQNAVPYLHARISGGGGDYVQSSIAVHTGASTSESFDCRFDDVCINRKQNGAQMGGAIALGGPYSFTESQTGTVYSFNSLQFDSGFGQPDRQVWYYASSITYRDGEVITFTYDKTTYASGQGPTHHRLTRMSSNLGYYISFTYQGSDINYPSWHAVSEAALYKASEPDTPLGRLTYSPGIVTDLAGRTYSCSGCSNGIRSPAEWSSVTMTLPGESSPQLEVTPIVVPYASKSIVSSVERDGVTWNYTYGNARATPGYNYTYDNVVVTGPAGYRMTYNMKSATVGPTLVSSAVDALGRTTSYTYDDNFRLTQVTFPEDNWVEMTYDAYGNVTSKVTRPKPGSGLAAITESAGIDAAACDQNRVLCFRPTWYRDGLGRQTDYVYDGRGRLIQRTDPADSAGVRRVTYLSYAGSFTAPAQIRVCGLGTTCGTSAEIKTQYTYLGFTALPLTVTRTDGAAGTSFTTTYAYDDAGRVLSEDGPLPGSDDSSHFRYDVLGRKTWEVGRADEDGTRPAKRYTYRNSDDRVVTVETGTVPTPSSTAFTLISRSNTTYDARRNPIKTAISSSDGVVRTVQSVSYDARGQLICSTIRMNPAAFGSVPADACVAGSPGSQGADRITRNVYDTAGQLKQIQKAYGTPLQQNYATYTYSQNGQQTSVTDANGNRAEMRYDGHNRQVRWVFPHPTSTGIVDEGDYEAYTYDAAGNRLSLRKRDGSTLSYQYDALNRVIRKTVPSRSGLEAAHTRDVFYRYDIRGLQTDARFDSLSGHGVQTVYDGFGRATRVTDTMDGITRHLDYQYDNAGNRTQLRFPDAINVNYVYEPGGQFDMIRDHGNAVIADYAYNARGELSRINRDSTAPDQDWTYDAIGRLASTGWSNAGANNATWSFTRNAASQIATETLSNRAYTWDGHSDKNWAFVANGLNQYTSVDGVQHCYDDNGNLTLDGSYVYLYDVENRLVEMRAKANTSCLSLAYTGQLKAKLHYDPLGRLYKVENYLNGVAQGPTRFLHDGDALVAEYNASGAMLKRYVHGPNAGTDDPIAEYTGASVAASARSNLYADARGSIVLRTLSTGSGAQINSYDAYGVPGTANGRFQYTGQVWLDELGMYYYKARIYSPRLGRFMQTDPIGYEDNVNLYAYAGNDPINGIDPTGLAQANTCSLAGGKGCSGAYAGMFGNPTGSGMSPIANVAPDGSSGSTGNSGRGGPRGGQFVPPTNPPSEPPLTGPTENAGRGGGQIGPGRDGSTIRVQPRSPETRARGYPHGYWVETKGGNAIDPSTGKPPPGNLTPQERAARIHVPLPSDSGFNPRPVQSPSSGFTIWDLRKLNPIYLACYFVGVCNPSPLN